MPVHTDSRDVREGQLIPKENYCDQPYIVVTPSGSWVCVLTTGPGLESTDGQHVVATASRDHGRTWSDLVDIEPPGAYRSSWVTPVVVPGGRIYAIYNYDYDGNSSQHGGHLVYRFSDDEGRSWSPERYRIPLRRTRQDRENAVGGRTQYFWCIDKPVICAGSVYFGIPKLANGLPLYGGESWVVRSSNIVDERDPERIEWELLPEGDIGISAPELGSIQEEQNVEVLSDGSLYMAMRTEIGHPAYTVSRDHRATWSKPKIMRYADGRPIKHPRACPRVWKAENGRFLLWFHNNGFPGWGNSANRNPVWISGGIEADGDIRWSQPEVLLYDPDPTMRGMSYPDFVEENGRVWVSETQKSDARVHEIDRRILQAVWNDAVPGSSPPTGVIYDSEGPLGPGSTEKIPELPPLGSGGLTVELWLRLESLIPRSPVASTYGRRQRGFQVNTADGGALSFELHDGKSRRLLEVVDGPVPERNVRSLSRWSWETDRGILHAGKLHHLVFIADGQANVFSIVADGRLCDGGSDRIQGWWRLNPQVRELNDEGILRIPDDLDGKVERLRIYGRHLLTNEAVGSFHAGP